MSFVVKVNTIGNTALSLVNNTEVSEVRNLEKQFLTDLIRSARDMHYLMFDVGLDATCDFSICEKYITNNRRKKYKQLLTKRGSRILQKSNTATTYHRRDTINAGSSQKDLCIIKAKTSTLSMYAVIELRKYNAKSQIMIFSETDIEFDVIKRYLLLHSKIFNVYIVRMQANSRSIILYEMCAFCNRGRSKFIVWNSWKLGKGFKNTVKYSQSFKGTFFGGQVHIGVLQVAPSIFQVGVNSDGSPVYSGTDYLVLQTLSKYLDFKLIIHPRKNIYTHNDNLRGFPISITYNYHKRFDMTAVYFYSGSIIISARPGSKDTWKTSLDPVLLTLVLNSYVSTVLAYWLVSKYGYRESGASLLNTLFNFLGIMFLEAIRPPHNIMSHTVGTWMICCFIGISLIFGEITSIVSTPALSADTIDSVQHMIAHNMSWISHPYFTLDRVLLNNDDINAVNDTHHLIERRLRMGVHDGLRHILKHPHKYVYYFPRAAVESVVNKEWNGTNPFHYSPIVEGALKHRHTALVRKDAPFREAITMKLLQMTEAGLHDQKFIPDVMDWFRGSHQREENDEKETFTGFGMGHMNIILCIYAFGVMVATIAFIFELGYYKYQVWRETSNRNIIIQAHQTSTLS